MITPISVKNHYAHNIRAAADGCALVLIATPGAELIRLDPESGEYDSFTPHAITAGAPKPGALTFLDDGCVGIACDDGIRTLDYPAMVDSGVIPFPAGASADWLVFRDWGDGRLYVHQGDGGPLFVLNAQREWVKRLDRFVPEAGAAKADRFCALPDGGVLGLSMFGEIIECGRDGSTRMRAQLNNYGYQRYCYLQPGDGSRVFTTTFINSSFQEVDYRTGEGRNIRPCQKRGGQPAGAAWHDGRLWLAAYGGAEISVYDPGAGGEWPENPRPVLDIGHEQMRPVGLHTDGRLLWTATHAQYGKLGGALVRIDPRSATCKVWRNLVPDHNPTGLAVDVDSRRVYVGTTVHADCRSAPPAEGAAAVFAFDMAGEEVAWASKPVQEAESLQVLTRPVSGALPVAAYLESGDWILLLDADTGKETRRFRVEWPEGWEKPTFFLGSDGRLYVASNAGIFEYDLDSGVGQQRIAEPVSHVAQRGPDLFFIRENDIGVVEGFFDVGV